MAADGPVYGVPTDIIDDVLPHKEEGSVFKGPPHYASLLILRQAPLPPPLAVMHYGWPLREEKSSS